MKTILTLLFALVSFSVFAQGPVVRGPGTTNTPAAWTNVIKGVVAESEAGGVVSNASQTNQHLFGTFFMPSSLPYDGSFPAGFLQLQSDGLLQMSFDGQLLTNIDGSKITIGTVADARIASTLTRDTEYLAVVVWTNSAGVIKPSGAGTGTNELSIFPSGDIQIGTNAEAFFGGDFGYGLQVYRKPSAGDVDFAGVQLYVENGTNNANYNGFEFGADSGGADLVQRINSAIVFSVLDGNVTATGGTNWFTGDVGVGGTNRVTKLRVGGAAETTDAVNVTGSLRVSGAILAADGSIGSPSLTFANSPGYGFYRRSSSAIAVVAGGNRLFGFGSPGAELVFANDIKVGWSADTDVTAHDLTLARKAAADLRQGSSDSATPVAQTFSVQNASGANVSGADRKIVGSQSTGTGTGGAIVFQTSPAGASSSTANPLVTALTIDSSGMVTTSNLTVNGSVVADGFVGDGSALTNLTVPAGQTMVFNGKVTLNSNVFLTSLSFATNAAATGAALYLNGGYQAISTNNNVDFAGFSFLNGTGNTNIAWTSVLWKNTSGSLKTMTFAGINGDLTIYCTNMTSFTVLKYPEMDTNMVWRALN